MGHGTGVALRRPYLANRVISGWEISRDESVCLDPFTSKGIFYPSFGLGQGARPYWVETTLDMAIVEGPLSTGNGKENPMRGKDEFLVSAELPGFESVSQHLVPSNPGMEIRQKG